MDYNFFNRSGLASLTDLTNSEYLELYKYLETEQVKFLDNIDKYRSTDYKWPKDALHNWSRIWEYPYVYFHLCNLREKYYEKDNITVVDFGSGVTFFPFAIENLKYKVICVDNDPKCINDNNKAIDFFNKNNTIFTKLVLDTKIPLSDSSIDILYSISVLEHIDNHELVIDEINRILKPNGVLILTIDIAMRSDSDIYNIKYRKLKKSLLANFNYLSPDMSIHPADMLNTHNSPFPIVTSLNGFNRLTFTLTQKIKLLLEG